MPPVNETNSAQPLVPAVQRAVLILELIGSSSGPLALHDIAGPLKLPKSSTLAICRTLVHEGLLERSTDGGYGTGLRLVRFASRHLGAVDLTQAFGRAVESESAQTHTLQLAVLQDTSVVYLSRRDSRPPVGLASNTGRSLPASTTAVGKAILAWLPKAEVRRRYGATPLPRLTAASRTRLPALLADLEATRTRGYSVDREETADGVICVGAPVWRLGEPDPVCALSITAIAGTKTVDRIASMGRKAQELAGRMSTMLGGEPVA